MGGFSQIFLSALADEEKQLAISNQQFPIFTFAFLFSMQLTSHSPKETQKIASKLAKELKEGEVLCLFGDLGGGKTTFVQGLAKGLGIKKRVTSPSFVLMRKYPIYGHLVTSLYHIDCYRIKSAKEILDIGFNEILEDKNAVIAVEWADKIKKILPDKRVDIKFEFVDEKTREIDLEVKGRKYQKLLS